MNLNELNNKDPIEISKMIEEGKFNQLNQIEWLDLCNLLMEKYENNEMYNQLRIIRKETLVHTSEIRNDIKKLVPIVGSEFDFEEEDLKYFASKGLTTSNPLLKAKFADIVWQEAKEKSTKFASIASEGYREMIDFYFERENFSYLTEILVHSLDLLITSENQDKLENCVKKLEETIKNLIDINIFRWLFDLIKVLIDNYEKVKDLIDKDILVISIRKGKSYYENTDNFWKNRFEELERYIL